jgi:hypothetical protein
MEHCATPPGPNDPKITGSGVATVEQQEGGYGKSQQEKDHLLLSFAFVTIVSLSFWQKLLSLSIPVRRR